MDKILKLLGENSNLTAGELALLLGEPEEYVSKQIKEYEDQGIIAGYRAIINMEKVSDPEVTAIIDLKVKPKQDKGFEAIAEKVMAFEEVDTVYLMAGAFDLLVIVKGKSVGEVASFVAQKLSPLETVQSTSTHFLLKRYKEFGVNFHNEEEEDKRSLVL